MLCKYSENRERMPIDHPCMLATMKRYKTKNRISFQIIQPMDCIFHSLLMMLSRCWQHEWHKHTLLLLWMYVLHRYHNDLHHYSKNRSIFIYFVEMMERAHEKRTEETDIHCKWNVAFVSICNIMVVKGKRCLNKCVFYTE